MKKIGNMEVKELEDGIIIITENLEDKIGTYVSKPSDDTIESRYLRALAIAILGHAESIQDEVIHKSKMKGCPKCFGSGGKVKNPCRFCDGIGKVNA